MTKLFRVLLREKIVTKTKEYILNLYSDGYSTHQNMVNGLKNGIDYFVGRKDGIDTIKDENYYWEPLSKTKNNIRAISFEDDLFKPEDVQKIIDILKSISGDRIYLLSEENINYEVETSSFDIDWIESAYSDFETSWLIYISHEGTITFAGEEFVTRIENELTEIVKHKNPWN